MLATLIRILRPPHPLDGGEGLDAAYRAQLYEVRVRDWRWRINHTVLACVFSIIGICWALSPAGIPMLGALAWANETEAKIHAAVVPIQSKIDKIEEQTREIKKQQEAKELADLRQKLFETRIAQCKARDKKGTLPGNNPYSAKMDELQAQYYGITNSYYKASNCEDL